MSLLLDADLQRVDPTVGGVNHLPLVTSMRLGDGTDAFAALTDLLDGDAAEREQPVWLNPLPAAMHYRKVSARPEWTKADVIAGNRIKLELFRRFGVLPGSSDTHVAEFFPGFVTPRSDFGREWSVHHYGLSGHMADKAADDAGVEEMLATDEITRDAVRRAGGAAPRLAADPSAPPAPGERCRTRGQVENLDAGVVVECIGLAEDGEVRPHDRVTVPSIMGEFLRRASRAPRS